MWAAVLAFVMAAAALAGCDGEASVESPAQPQDQAAADKKAPTPRDITDAIASANDGDAQTAAASDGPELDPRPVYDLLAETVEAAVKVDTFDDLVERFAEADRKRLGRVSKDALNAQTTALRDAWKARFEEEFNIIDTAANFKLMTRVERLPSAGETERARVVVQPREPGQRPLELVLVREDEKWRIDLPDDIDRQKLQDALAQRLGALKQESAKWTEQVQGHRDVAYQALSAMAQPIPDKPTANKGKPQAGR
jgi:hypothetical protein